MLWPGLREFIRLDRRRVGEGLSPQELRRWRQLSALLGDRFAAEDGRLRLIDVEHLPDAPPDTLKLPDIMPRLPKNGLNINWLRAPSIGVEKKDVAGVGTLPLRKWRDGTFLKVS